jgi:cytoskeleton protein RodZ
VPETSAIPAAPDLPADDAGGSGQLAALPAEGGSRIVLEARMDSWVEIVDPNQRRVFSQVLRSGERYAVPPEPGLVLTTGNAGGLDVIVDGVKLPPIGEVGAVRRGIALDEERLKAGTAFGD